MRRAAPVIDEAAAREVQARIASIEQRCGVQIVCAVHRRSDTYPEAPGHAFALGAVVTAAIVVWLNLLYPSWSDAGALVADLFAVIGVAVFCGLLTVVWPWWARVFINRRRRDIQVEQRAKALFLERAVFSTRRHNGVLLYASMFERKVQIVADRAFDSIEAHQWQGAIDAMAPALREGRCDPALLAGLDAIEKILVEGGFVGSGNDVDELPNAVIQAERT